MTNVWIWQINIHITLTFCVFRYASTHWGRVTHICFRKLTDIGSDNGLSPGWCQAIIWTKAGILLIRTLGTNFSETFSEIHPFINIWFIRIVWSDWGNCVLLNIAELWYQICILFEGQVNTYPRHSVYCSYMMHVYCNFLAYSPFVFVPFHYCTTSTK